MNTSLSAAALAAIGLLSSAHTLAAAASPVPASPSSAMLAPAARAFLQQRAQRLHLKPSAARQSYIKLDVDAPVLTSFTALSTDVDSSQPGAQLGYSYTGTDDYAGANTVWVSLRTDDYAGWTYLQADVGYPDTSLKGKVAVDALGLAPGHWTVEYVNVSDAQGNTRYYSADDLRALGGQIDVQVVGSRGDGQPPSVASGKILTPTVSKSALQKGTQYTHALAGMKVKLKDTAETSVSGVRSVQAVFCSNAYWDCLTLQASTTVRQLTSLEFRPEVDPSSYGEGEYHLSTLTMTDWAGNTRTLTSVVDGGDTDFSTLFAGTTITLVP